MLLRWDKISVLDLVFSIRLVLGAWCLVILKPKGLSGG